MQNRIREIRKKHGITMKQLGQELGLGESTISQYETGKRQPDNETLLKISEYFDVTVGYLLGVEGGTDTATEAQESSSIDDEAAMLFQSLSESKKEAALEYLRYLSNDSKKP